MASSGPAAPPAVGPVLARVHSDPAFYHNANTDAKVAVEKAIAEEKLEMFKPNHDVVTKDPPPLLLRLRNGTSGGVVPLPKERTALWHVLFKDDHDEHAGMIKVVYLYAHFESENDKGEGGAALLDALNHEFRRAEKEGKLWDQRAFGIAQAGMQVSFWAFDGAVGGVRGVNGGF